jgi:hypothetical protein
MKSTLIRSGAAAIVASLAFAACAGGSNNMVPSSSGFPATSNAIHVSPDGTSPCPIPVGWSFGGSCDPVVLQPTGGKGKLKGYMGYTLTSTLSSNTAAANQVLVFQDATGKGDIKTNASVGNAKFPLNKGAFLYLAALNTGAAFKFNSSPAIKLTSKAAFTKKSCALWETKAKGKGFIWVASGITATAKGKVLAFPSLPVPGGEAIPAGPFYLSFVCK